MLIVVVVVLVAIVVGGGEVEAQGGRSLRRSLLTHRLRTSRLAHRRFGPGEFSMVGLSCISPARSKLKLGAVAALDRPGLGRWVISALGRNKWSGRRESNPHGQLGRLRPLRRQGHRSVVGPGQGAPLLTVVDRC